MCVAWLYTQVLISDQVTFLHIEAFNEKLNILQTAMSNFEVFKNEFQGDIVTPTDQDYAAAITRWATSAERKAKVVAFVKDDQDVARAIKYAKADDLPIAVRGGGHNPSGASSSDGLVIDLSRYINAITVDPDNKLARVGGGAMWEDVDKVTMQHGLASVAPTVRNVRIATHPFGLNN